MKADRHVKVLLAIIALALLLNALNPWLRPMPVAAQRPPADLPMMEVHLRNMDSTLDGVARNIQTLVAAMAGGPEGKTCAWTVIDDGGAADIGRDGNVSLTPAWRSVSRGGWTLEAVHGDEYVFERCR
jgi:hypothetical protein